VSILLININVHFADDILLFLEVRASNIEALKWILIAFEDLKSVK
jgi:hypothetical protein